MPRPPAKAPVALRCRPSWRGPLFATLITRHNGSDCPVLTATVAVVPASESSYVLPTAADNSTLGGVTRPRRGVTGPRRGVTGPRRGVTGPRRGVTGPRRGVTGPRRMSSTAP
jgi:hypothetical protein